MTAAANGNRAALVRRGWKNQGKNSYSERHGCQNVPQRKQTVAVPMYYYFFNLEPISKLIGVLQRRN
jgi:hypothetical protein